MNILAQFSSPPKACNQIYSYILLLTNILRFHKIIYSQLASQAKIDFGTGICLFQLCPNLLGQIDHKKPVTISVSMRRTQLNFRSTETNYVPLLSH